MCWALLQVHGTVIFWQADLFQKDGFSPLAKFVAPAGQKLGSTYSWNVDSCGHGFSFQLHKEKLQKDFHR